MAHGKMSVLLMLDGYTFFKSGVVRKGVIRYRCSSTNKGCKANAHVTDDNLIIKCVTLHNHEQPKLLKLIDGKYARINP